MRALLPIVALLLAGVPAQARMETVKPSAADPAVRQFDDPSIVIAEGKADKDAPLALFLPGTGGKPRGAIDLLQVVAGQGYRVIGLAYDDEPAVVQVCPQSPDPDCSSKFRAMRVFGEGSGPVSNPIAEGIAARLVAALRALDKAHPGEGWAAYLTADGQPQWSRILVSGLSQGAGMAAFIAKRYSVYRVVLFSSPWDFQGRDRTLAPWIAAPSATPPERWWAERHAREKTSDLLTRSYEMLKIPPAQTLVFDGDLPPGTNASGPNPYHGSTIRNPDYRDKWKLMFGKVGK